jgi:hypothetical protein
VARLYAFWVGVQKPREASRRVPAPTRCRRDCSNCNHGVHLRPESGSLLALLNECAASSQVLRKHARVPESGLNVAAKPGEIYEALHCIAVVDSEVSVTLNVQVYGTPTFLPKPG